MVIELPQPVCCVQSSTNWAGSSDVAWLSVRLLDFYPVYPCTRARKKQKREKKGHPFEKKKRERGTSILICQRKKKGHPF